MNEMQLRDFLDLFVFDAYLLTMNSSPGHDRIPMAFFSNPGKSQKGRPVSSFGRETTNFE